MSDVWERASDVIAGRAGILGGLALLFVWLPGVVRGGARLTAPAAPTPGAAIALAALGLAAAVLAALGHMAMVAVASDPAVGQVQALRVARARFWAYVGIMLPIAVAALALIAPVGVAIAAAYPSMAAMQSGVPPQLSAGGALFVAVYSIVLLVVFLWAEARLLSVLVPVIVNERLGLGSYARAIGLTRGLTWRIVGVIVLFAIVAIVAVLAVQGVVGVGLRLALGGERAATALFLTAAVVSLVGAAITVVVSAFTAQLYVATWAGTVRGGTVRGGTGPWSAG